jgi:hypothetical protein
MRPIEPLQKLARPLVIQLLVWSASTFMFLAATSAWVVAIVAFAMYSKPYALYLMAFWIPHMTLAGLSFASALMTGSGDAIIRIGILNAITILVSVVAACSSAGIWIWAWTFWWDCVLGTGSLDVMETFICTDHQWVFTYIFWGDVVAFVAAGFCAVAFTADLLLLYSGKSIIKHMRGAPLGALKRAIER